ncbi:MAG: 4'-phosphopantetheinyl transferase superfamily protein [Clostridia bacterium]|nr:4'-phosphopantetheinyl transferase superfamily protein [Clostridia bacterium]
MSEERKKKCDSFKTEQDKKLCIAADMLLRRVLSEKTGVKPELQIFASDERGKLSLVNGKYNFNISHSGNYAVVAVNKQLPVGIDIEQIRPVKANILRRICAKEEILYVLGENAYCPDILEDCRTSERFFKIWTYKEAYLKCTGEGICGELKRIVFNENKCHIEMFDGYCLNVITGEK